MTRRLWLTVVLFGLLAWAAGLAVGAPAGGGPESPAGRPAGNILFADDTGGSSDLFLMDLATGTRGDLTSSPGVDEVEPRFAPDGGRAAYAALQDGLWRIRVLDLGSRSWQAVTSGPEDLAPDWSPDGERLLFTAHLNRGTALQSSFLMTVDPDGAGASPVIALTDPARLILGGRWSPDGTRIALAVSGQSGAQIYVVGSHGSGAALLFDHPGWDDLDPAWSPDGRLLAFASGPVPADGAAARHDIWLLDPAGRVAGTVIVDSHADMRRPCWSPDGRYLAFDASDPPGSRRSIRVAPLAGATVGSALTSGREAAWQGSMPPAPTSPATATPSLAAPSVTAEGTAVTPSPPAVTEFPTAPTLAPFPTPAATGPTWAPPAPTFPPNELGGSAFLPRALRRSSVREAP